MLHTSHTLVNYELKMHKNNFELSGSKWARGAINLLEIDVLFNEGPLGYFRSKSCLSAKINLIKQVTQVLTQLEAVWEL